MSKILAYERIEHCRKKVRIFILEKEHSGGGTFSALQMWRWLLYGREYRYIPCCFSQQDQDTFFFYWSLLVVCDLCQCPEKNTKLTGTILLMKKIWAIYEDHFFDMFQGMNFALNREVSFTYLCKLSQDALVYYVY